MNLTTVHHLFRVSSIIYAPLMNRSLCLYTAYIYHESAIFIPYAMAYKYLGIINHSRITLKIKSKKFGLKYFRKFHVPYIHYKKKETACTFNCFFYMKVCKRSFILSWNLINLCAVRKVISFMLYAYIYRTASWVKCSMFLFITLEYAKCYLSLH